MTQSIQYGKNNEKTLEFYAQNAWDTGDIVRLLDKDSELFSAASHGAPVPLRINIDKHGTNSLVPGELWGARDILALKAKLEERFGTDAFRATPAGCARAVVRKSLNGLPVFGKNKLMPDEVELFSEQYFQGPWVRAFEKNYSENATLIDLNAAYWVALQHPLPCGRPARWSEDYAPGQDGAETIPEIGLVEAEVEDVYDVLNFGHGFGGRGMFRGTAFELKRGIEEGRFLRCGPARGWVFSSNQGQGEALNELLGDWVSSDDKDERFWAKVLYTRGWISHVWPGYLRGKIGKLNGDAPADYTIADQHVKNVWWRLYRPDVEERGHILQRPDRSAHICAAVRVTLQQAVQDIIEAGGIIHQILTDAIIYSGADDAILNVGVQPGQFKRVVRGEYQHISPGRYQFRDKHGNLLRNKNAGYTKELENWNIMQRLREDEEDENKEKSKKDKKRKRRH